MAEMDKKFEDKIGPKGNSLAIDFRATSPLPTMVVSVLT
jgi:hypothetical protein